MTSRDLYAIAGEAERLAKRDHTTLVARGAQPDWTAAHIGCAACHFEAKARLYVRAGDAARRLEDR